MSSTSGIKGTDELITQFNEFINSNKRSMFIVINNEACHPGSQIDGSHDFIADLDTVRSQLEHNEAAYFIHRLDNKLKPFVFTAFVPDYAPVRSKMLYASSAPGLHQQLGGSDRFGEIVFMTELDEVSKEGWNQHENHVNAVDPQTEEEHALQTALDHEADQMLGTSGRRSHLDLTTTSDTSNTSSVTGSQTGTPINSSGSGGPLSMQFDDSVGSALNELLNMQNAALGLVSS